jgi:intraflagellar transport protein 88
LLVASCLRRAGQFHKAFTEYQDIHKNFPENTECLKFLIRLCNDLGLKEAQSYAIELRKIEKAKENKDRHSSGRPETNSKFIKINNNFYFKELS